MYTITVKPIEGGPEFIMYVPPGTELFGRIDGHYRQMVERSDAARSAIILPEENPQ